MIRNLMVGVFAIVLTGCASVPPGKNCRFKPTNAEGVDQQDILCVQRAMIPKLKACYENLLGKTDNVEPKFTSKYEITQSGIAQAIVLDPVPKDAAFSRCVSGVYASSVFPKHSSTKKVTVSFPLNFKKKN